MKKQESGIRYNKGKLRWRNFPLFLMRPLAEVGNASELRDGNPTGKYPTFNFLKGLSALDCMDSLTRHLDEFQDPNKPDIDPEDGCHVLAKVAWNALVCLHHIQNNPELYDDRYKGILKRKKSNVQKEKTNIVFRIQHFSSMPKKIRAPLRTRL